MCLILLAYKHVSGFDLVLAANRDEYLDRPTAPLGYHYPGERILAGKDLQGGGTWLAVNASGRLAALTNFREPGHGKSDAPSRGDIILDYLRSGLSATAFVDDFKPRADQYNGFNLLLADNSGLFHYSNRGLGISKLEPGVHGLSNHLLNTDWPKVQRGKKMLNTLSEQTGRVIPEIIFQLLKDSTLPADDQLPVTGVGKDWERVLSPLFIHSPGYGTRSSSVVTIAENGHVEFSECTFNHARGVRETGRKRYAFHLKTLSE